MNDMDWAGEVYGAMRDARVLLRREPIRHVSGNGDVLYCECLATVVDARGNLLHPAQFIPPLERLQLIRAFDRHVLRQAVTLLRASPDVRLGINLSGRSAVVDIAWEAVLQLIERTPEVARRLVVEITETARLDPEQGRRFAQRLQQAGCRVAIDDFGVGYGVETAIEIRTPDVIKIDASFVVAARYGEAHLARLERLVRLASELAEYVVVEGVEQPEDMTRAQQCGAKWVQGWFVRDAFSGAGVQGGRENGNEEAAWAHRHG